MAKVENIQDSPVLKKFNCEIELSEVNAKVEVELQEIAKTAEIKGFRKGNAPMKMIKELYNSKAYNTAIDKLMRETISDIAKKYNFKLAASPSVNVNEEEKEKIAFEVMFELLPEMPSDFDFSQIKVNTYETSITEDEMQQELEMIADRNKNFTTKEGKSEKGDIVVIDAVGRVDGVEFTGGKLENHELELGSGAFIPGFEDQLINASANEDVVVSVTFPAEYHAKDLAGKEAQFYTTVKEVKQPEKAELNDELAKKLSFKDLEEMKQDVKSKIEGFYVNAHKDKLKEEVFEKLSKALSFDISENMVEKVSQSIVEEKKLPSEDAPKFKEEAERRLRLSFFLNHIASNEKISVTDQDFTSFIVQNASQSGMNPMEMLNFYSQNKDAKRKLEILLEENKIYDFIFNKISLSKESIPKDKFDEILGIKK